MQAHVAEAVRAAAPPAGERRHQAGRRPVTDPRGDDQERLR